MEAALLNVNGKLRVLVMARDVPKAHAAEVPNPVLMGT
jgi:hypothetical protein